MQIPETTAIVTGAASGLGTATAARLAANGARVVGLDLHVEDAPSMRGVTYVATDVTDDAQVRAAVATATDGDPLRIVVNCAGIAPSMRILSRGVANSLGVYAQVLNVNLVGTFNVMAITSEAIAQTDPDEHGQRGVIVNTASIAAYEGQVGQIAYASSKAGVAGMTLPAARDLAQFGIRVCSIAPGVIDTPMLAAFSEDIRHGLAAGVPFPRRLGKPAEFAQLVQSIIEHDYLNGETIRMDGALRMSPR